MTNQINNQPNIIETDNKATQKPRHNKALTAALLALSLVACQKPDEIAPEVKGYTVTITQPEKLYLDTSGEVATIKLGHEILSTLKDETTGPKQMKISVRTPQGRTYYGIEMNGVPVDEPGIYEVTGKDEAGNSKTGNARLNYLPPSPPEFSLIENISISEPTTLTIGDKRVRVGDKVILEWTENDCKIELKLAGTDTKISSGFLVNKDTSIEATLSKNNLSSKPQKVEINFEDLEDQVKGLENLNNLNMQVDQPINNLLDGVTFSNGAQPVKVEVEIDGQRYEVTPPYYSYTPEYPGTCNIILTVEWKGNTTELTSNNLTIAPKEFTPPTLDSIDITTVYPRINNLNEATQEFMQPRIRLSYYILNRYTKGDRLHIILGETCDGLENIGEGGPYENSNHAFQGKSRISRLGPGVEIKSCIQSIENGGTGSSFEGLEDYINKHPNTSFIVSYARTGTLQDNRDDWNNLGSIISLKRMINNPRVTRIDSGINKSPSSINRIIYNENIKNGNFFGGGSANGNLDNHFLSIGRNIGFTNNYFSPQHGVGLKGFLPEGFDDPGCTTPVYMTPLMTSGGNPDYDTSCSYSAAVFAADLGNGIDAIKLNHTDITQAGAAKMIKEKYLQTEPVKIKDPNTGELVEKITDPVTGELVGGGHISTIDERKLIQNEVWQLDKLKNIQLNSNSISELPSIPGIYYEGKGVYFEIQGERYPNIKKNQSILEQAYKSGENIKRGIDVLEWRKQGGKDSLQLKVYTVDKDAKLFVNDHYLTIKIPVTPVNNGSVSNQTSHSLGETLTYAEKKYLENLGDYGKGTYGEMAGTYGQNLGGYGESNSGYGGKSDSGYGGKPDSGFGGIADSGYGGKPDSGFGGIANSNSIYGGKPDSGYGGIANSNSIYGGKPDSGYGGKGNHEKHLA